jgi:integrase
MSTTPVRADLFRKAKTHELLASSTALRDTVLIDARPEKIQTMSRDELVVLQSKLGFGSTFGIWETPPSWIPAGHRQPYMTRIDFRHRLAFLGVPESHLEAALDHVARYAVLLTLVPTGRGRANGRYLKPFTVAQILYRLVPNLIASSAKRICSEGSIEASYFGRVTQEDLDEQESDDFKRDLRQELSRVTMLCERGMWTDRPGIDAPLEHREHTPVVKGKDARPKAEHKTGKHQPLPDEYVADCGWRVLWVVKELGPTLLKLAHQFVDVISRNPVKGSNVHPETVSRWRREQFGELIAAHQWIGSDGNSLKEPPFPLTLTRKMAKFEAGQWPPTSSTQVTAMLQLLQMAHLWIVLLSVGSRIGEMLSVTAGSVVHSSDGTPFANGLTYKLVDAAGGVERDWPLPDVALEAMRQQEELSALIKSLGYLSLDPDDSNSVTEGDQTSLWSRVGSAGEFTTEVSRQLREMSINLGLTDKPGGSNLVTHRFRKTVARLAALALAGAPKILMDLFGHKSIEMTLYYILTDPIVQAEIKQVVEEVAVMRAKDAIEDVENYGGPAAKKLSETVIRERARLGRDLGANDIRQLAEVLTLSGQSWAMVRPGVICTKLPGSAGPCTKQVGRPEPSRCRWTCDHRLEEAVHRDDVDRSIAEAVRLYELERADENEMGQEFWAGQILAHVRRFEDIFQKWSTNPSVVQVLNSQEQAA